MRRSAPTTRFPRCETARARRRAPLRPRPIPIRLCHKACTSNLRGIAALVSRLRMERAPEALLPTAAANEPDADTLDRERGCARIDDDRLERSILGHEDDFASTLAKTLDGHLVAAHARHDDLTVARFARSVHGEQVAIEYAGIVHAFAANAQQVIGAG